MVETVADQVVLVEGKDKIELFINAGLNRDAKESAYTICVNGNSAARDRW
jgi:hypothetical protein